MLILRKIDCYAQLVLGVLMLLSIPFLFLFGVLAGLFILGCWQLLSAACNTPTFLHTGLSGKIIRYWKFTALDLLLIFICWPLAAWFDSDDLQVLLWTAACGSVPIAVYYWNIYHHLISQLELRNELSGFTKSR